MNHNLSFTLTFYIIFIYLCAVTSMCISVMPLIGIKCQCAFAGSLFLFVLIDPCDQSEILVAVHKKLSDQWKYTLRRHPQS